MSADTEQTQFRQEEIVVLKRWDKQKQEEVTTLHPKVGGRLRLAHDENDQSLSIETEIHQLDELVVVQAKVKTAKGTFSATGTACSKRDPKIALSLIELAETRAIARALRFAGYGVEYCSAEEVSHLEEGSDSPPKGKKPPKSGKPSDGNETKPKPRNAKGGNGNAKGNGNGLGPQIDGVTYRKDGNLIIAEGNTFQSKGLLKSAGFKWTPDEKCWAKEVS